MRRSFRWVSVLALAILLAGCGASTTRLAGKATATDTPLSTVTPRPTATPTPQLSLRAPDARCAATSTTSPDAGTTLSDMRALASPSNLASPGTKLPDGLPLAPYQLSARQPSDPPFQLANPNLHDSGYLLNLCNTSATASHTVDSVTVRIATLTPYTGQLNEWPACDNPYMRQGMGTGGCGGADPADLYYRVTFSTGAGQGTTLTAAQYAPPNLNFRPWVTPFPLTLAPGHDVVIKVTLDVPGASGIYDFAFSVGMDGAAPASMVTRSYAEGQAVGFLLAPVVHTWTGGACLAPTMQAQIPPADHSAYLCPNV
jgi:hypothetical protein